MNAGIVEQESQRIRRVILQLLEKLEKLNRIDALSSSIVEDGSSQSRDCTDYSEAVLILDHRGRDQIGMLVAPSSRQDMFLIEQALVCHDKFFAGLFASGDSFFKNAQTLVVCDDLLLIIWPPPGPTDGDHFLSHQLLLIEKPQTID